MVRCHVCSSILRMCFLPSPCCGNRHGQCREQHVTSVQPTRCWVLTLLSGRIVLMTRSHSLISPGQASAHVMRSFHTPLSFAPALLMHPSPRYSPSRYA